MGTVARLAILKKAGDLRTCLATGLDWAVRSVQSANSSKPPEVSVNMVMPADETGLPLLAVVVVGTRVTKEEEATGRTEKASVVGGRARAAATTAAE